jgi:hypothetical protein
VTKFAEFTYVIYIYMYVYLYRSLNYFFKLSFNNPLYTAVYTWTLTFGQTAVNNEGDKAQLTEIWKPAVHMDDVASERMENQVIT